MSHRHIALFTEMLDFDESYMDLVWRACDQKAIERDAHLMVCVGRRLDREEPENLAHNLLYSLALKHPFDALMVSQTVYQRSGAEQTEQFGALLAHLPTATASASLGKVPSIKYDNVPPFRDLLRHLIKVHGYRRILIVAGPTVFEEARIRLQVWHEELAAAGLEHGPEMIVEGHFHPSYIPAIGQAVFDRIHQTKAQAVVVSTDLVAAAVMHQLQARGMRIPDDVAITGYDDIPLVQFLDPPLTTVRQPVIDQYKAAIDLALRQKDGPDYRCPELKGKLVIRGSCGCGPDKWNDDRLEGIESPELVALSILRKIGSSNAVPIQPLRSSMILAHDRIRFLRNRVSELNFFSRRIDESTSIEALAAILDEWLPRLGIATYAISLACDVHGALLPQHLDPDAPKILPDSPRWHRVLASHPALPADIDRVFEACHLVPPEWLSTLPRTTLVALPLALSHTWYGMAVMAISQEGNLMCRSVQELTASFIDREFRLREMVRKNLEARIGTQMEAEKIQSITTFIAGVAHDLANPLGISRTTAGYLHNKEQQLHAIFRKDELTKSDLTEFFEDSEDALRILMSSIERAIDQVASFKRISAEVPRDELRTFKPVGFLRDLLRTLQPMWRSRMVSVNLEGPEDLEIRSHAAPFLDILTNLIQNSLVHAWPRDQGGTITVSVSGGGGRSGTCRLVFADDGAGIPPEHLTRIFEPFYTTRESQGGTGLGLHIIQQRVKALLAGTIRCESTIGEGTRFIIDFPAWLEE